MATAQDMQAQDDAFLKQYDEQAAAKTQQAEQAKQPPSFPSRWMAQVGRASLSQIDAAIADQPVEDNQIERKARDVGAGTVTDATNIVDAGVSLAKSVAGGGDAGPINQYVVNAVGPIWDHAKKAILDFRDAVQVKDPTLSDNLTQGAAQLAIPFAGYSRALAGLHGLASIAVAGAVTDATALGPHDGRFADLLALGQHTEGKLGDALRAMGPYGLNSYINYLTDNHPGADPTERAQYETEAQGRWRNVLDGFGVNLIATPIIHAAGVALKQGYAGVRYAMDNGALSTGDLFKMGPVAGSPAAQRGSIGIPVEPASHSAPVPTAPEAIAQVRQSIALANGGNQPQPLWRTINHLAEHLDASTPNGEFYKNLFGWLKEKKLKTLLVSPQEQGVADRATLLGHYNRVSDTMTITPLALGANRDALHTIGHEAVHAATMHAIAENPRIEGALTDLAREAGQSEAVKALATQDTYGARSWPSTFVSASEFAAEAHANPRFQQALKNTEVSKGRSLWDEYKETIARVVAPAGAGVLLANPAFDKLLTTREKGD